MTMKNNKKENGQFFTVTNPFRNDLFYKWLREIPDFENKAILEPFAGANNIVEMINEIGHENSWSCFDIDPPAENNFSKFCVEQRNTLESFPSGFDVVITNPPYLAKNSAKRDGTPFPETDFDDLYKFALDTMLSNSSYVAAIIPESFITSGLFHDRLFGVVSLTCKMFDDTDCPVCLALFIPAEQKRGSDPFGLQSSDFYIYRDSAYLGQFSDVEKFRLRLEMDGWRFNNPNGEIGLMGIDSTIGPSIRFVDGSEINPERVKSTSRGVTRISLDGFDIPDLKKLIGDANDLLDSYRENTNDIFLTSFRGLRRDGKYRRRLDYRQARCLLSMALAKQLEVSLTDKEVA